MRAFAHLPAAPIGARARAEAALDRATTALIAANVARQNYPRDDAASAGAILDSVSEATSALDEAHVCLTAAGAAR